MSPQVLAQGFWTTPAAGSLITGTATATTAIGVAIFTYLGGQRNLARQVSAARSSWRRDNVLKEVGKYLGVARGVADQAFMVGASQVVLLRKAGRPDDPTELSEQQRAAYLGLLESDKALEGSRDELRKRQHEFSELVHAVRLLLAPNNDLAEALRKETDQFFGCANKLDPAILDSEVHERSDRCRKLRIELEQEVAELLHTEEVAPATAPRQSP